MKIQIFFLKATFNTSQYRKNQIYFDVSVLFLFFILFILFFNFNFRDSRTYSRTHHVFRICNFRFKHAKKFENVEFGKHGRFFICLPGNQVGISGNRVGISGNRVDIRDTGLTFWETGWAFRETPGFDPKIFISIKNMLRNGFLGLFPLSVEPEPFF